MSTKLEDLTAQKWAERLADRIMGHLRTSLQSPVGSRPAYAWWRHPDTRVGLAVLVLAGALIWKSWAAILRGELLPIVLLALLVVEGGGRMLSGHVTQQLRRELSRSRELLSVAMAVVTRNVKPRKLCPEVKVKLTTTGVDEVLDQLRELHKAAHDLAGVHIEHVRPGDFEQHPQFREPLPAPPPGTYHGRSQYLSGAASPGEDWETVFNSGAAGDLCTCGHSRAMHARPGAICNATDQDGLRCMCEGFRKAHRQRVVSAKGTGRPTGHGRAVMAAQLAAGVVPESLRDDNKADLCECGHPRGSHFMGTGGCTWYGGTGPVKMRGGDCTCKEFKLREVDVSKLTTKLCYCGHHRGLHDSGDGPCLHADCQCQEFVPEPPPMSDKPDRENGPLCTCGHPLKLHRTDYGGCPLQSCECPVVVAPEVAGECVCGHTWEEHQALGPQDPVPGCPHCECEVYRDKHGFAGMERLRPSPTPGMASTVRLESEESCGIKPVDSSEGSAS